MVPSRRRRRSRCRPLGRSRRSGCGPRSRRSGPSRGLLAGKWPRTTPALQQGACPPGTPPDSMSAYSALRNGENAWPVVEYADIESGRVSAADLALLQRRGCLVVRGHFPREQALGWDRDIVDYVDRNASSRPTRGRPTTSSAASARNPDLPDLLVPRPDGGPAARPDGSRPVLPQRPVEEQLGGRPVVRPRPRLALPRPHPPPAPGRRLRRPGHRTWTRAPSTSG